MTALRRQSGQVTALVLVGVVLVGVPVGLTLLDGLATSTDRHSALPTVTPPELPTVTPDATPEPGTGTATPTPTADGNDTDGNGSGTGARTLVVDDDVGGAGGGAVPGSACDGAKYPTIQAAVSTAERGDVVRVCPGQYADGVDIDVADLTLRADGEATIHTVGRSAIRSTAPRVTIEGFTIRAEQADYTVAIGGRDTVVREVSVNATDVSPEAATAIGIFLGDGRGSGVVSGAGGTIGPSTGSRVIDSSVEVHGPTESSEDSFVVGVWADADDTIVRGSSFTGHGNATAIRSTGNGTVIRANDVVYPNPPQYHYRSIVDSMKSPAIKIGATRCNQGTSCPTPTVSPPVAHDWATHNIVADNSIDGAPCRGIRVNKVARHAIIRDNTIVNTPIDGIRVVANRTVVRDNRVREFARDVGIELSGHHHRAFDNTVTSGGFAGIGIRRGRNVTVVDNTVQQNRIGIYVGEVGGYASSGLVANNAITRNTFGISLYSGPNEVEAHYNRILNNDNLGIWVQNHVPTDGEWPVFNATNNIWGCGGPSGGLRDPRTETIADGSGDPLSAGDEPGYSNVHFDPFLEQSVCPSLTPTPTPPSTTTGTETPTVTPTPTRSNRLGGEATPTAVRETTPTATPDGGDGVGDGAGGAERVERRGDGQPGDQGGQILATPTPSPATTPTETPTETARPTPRVEPGFGIVSWILGVVVLVCVAALWRRAETRD